MKLFASFLIICCTFLMSSSFASNKIEDFTFVDIDGKQHDTKKYRGKWLLINYWGTYCPPCLEEIPDLIEFSDNNQDNAVVIGLDAGGTDIAGLVKFKEDYFINYTLAPVQESTLDAFGVLVGIPTSYLISPEGEISAKVVGIIDLKEVDQFINGISIIDDETAGL